MKAPLARPLLAVLCGGISISAAVPVLAAPQTGSDMSLGDVAEAQEGDDRRALEEAVTLLETGEHEKAAARLAVLASRPGPALQGAEYQLAKALYRLDFDHAALVELERVLQQGPQSPYFKPALEWSVFIGRRMNDDVAVNEVLVEHAAGSFPERYREEMMFRLARHHYGRALVKEAEAAADLAPVPVAPAAEPDPDEGISFDDDLFGAGSAQPAEEAEEEEDDSGMSFGADLFGEDEAPAPKARRKRRGRKRGRARAKAERETPKKPAAAPEKPVTPETMTPAQHREAARRLVTRIGKDSAFYARARFLEGLLMVQGHRENEALVVFKDVVEATAEVPEDESGEARRRRERLRELTFFQLARLHFGAGQPSFSIFYYKKVDRDSLQWLDALYEGSWAEYRLGRYEKALGNLLTVHAPFFDDTYYPESQILEAVIYYENCRYERAGSIIEGFLERYQPIFRQLGKMASEERSSADWYAMLAQLEEKEDPDEENRLLARVLEIALSDPELRRLEGSIEEVDAELERFRTALQKNPLAGAPRLPQIAEALEAEKGALQQAAGRSVERKLRFEAGEVKTLVAQALRVQVETARAEEGRLEASLSRRDQRPKQMAKDVIGYTDDEKLVWPFEGEYWRDELGTYELTLARSCR